MFLIRVHPPKGIKKPNLARDILRLQSSASQKQFDNRQVAGACGHVQTGLLISVPGIDGNLNLRYPKRLYSNTTTTTLQTNFELPNL
jgi:hypothetical protein